MQTLNSVQLELFNIFFLFLYIGGKQGCHLKLLSRIKSSGDNLETHLQHICTLAYFTNSRTLFYGEDGDSVDLMLTLKLSFSCGLLGYYELLTGEGLANVVGWQLNSGCFGDNSIIDEEKTRCVSYNKSASSFP